MSTAEIDTHSFLDDLPLGVYRWTLGPQGRFIYANCTFLKSLGLTMEQLTKMHVTDFFEKPSSFSSLSQKLMQQGFVKNEEVIFVTPNKRNILGLISLVVVKDKSGKKKWIDGTFEDITLQKRVERDLLESRELFKTVFTNSAVAIIVTDKNEKIVAWNPFAEKMLETNKEELFNKDFKDLFPSQEWLRVRSFKGGHVDVADIETRIYKHSKSVLESSISLSIIKDLEGNAMGYIAIIRDITKQKLAEQRIKESENKVRVILDNSPAAITLTDDQERIVLWNKFTEQLLGKKKEELYMQPVSSLYPEEEWKKIRAANIRKKGSQHHFETKVIAKGGKLIDIDLSVNILKDFTNRIIGSVGIMQDITEQKRVKEILLQAKQEAERANQTKSLFLANMSHEVRTPMNTVMGMIDLILDTELNDEQRENLTTAKDAADNLLSLLNDILDLSRVEADKVNLETIELNLQNIVQSVCKGLSVLATKKNLELVWTVDQEIPATLIGDPVRLRQILVNLINNAIKFTFKGKIQVDVKLISRTEHECEIQGSVVDEGIGISKEKQGNLFDVFSQADDSMTRRFGGTGLGLTICKRLVEMMKGRIWLESEDLKGSTFYFTVKLKIAKRKEAPAPLLISPEGEKISARSSLERLSILLAEDNIVNQKIAMKLLEKRGWQVTAVDNGQKVLDILGKEKFDVILMDAQMPVLDGFETTRMIRSNEKGTGQHIPIIALTARAMNEDKQKCLEMGMDGYVPKPIDRLNLYESIENVVNKKGSAHES